MAHPLPAPGQGWFIHAISRGGFDNLPHLTLSFDDSPRVVSVTGGPGAHLSSSGRGQIIKRRSKVGQIIKFAISGGFDNLPHLTLSFDDSPWVVSMTGGPRPHLSFSGRGQIIKRQTKVGQIIKFAISGRFDNWCEAYATTCLSCISMHPNPCREASQ